VASASCRLTHALEAHATQMATLQFHIVPNATQNKVMGEYGSAIRIKLRAPALEGKANAALRSFLADGLKIPERRIVLQHGQKSREKMVRIEGLSEEDVRRRLLATI
jgi:uncharacterized protein (TIGR00251 family)